MNEITTEELGTAQKVINYRSLAKDLKAQIDGVNETARKLQEGGMNVRYDSDIRRASASDPWIRTLNVEVSEPL